MNSSSDVYWRKWAPHQKCLDIIKSRCLIRKNKPKNLEYKSLNNLGTLYLRKTDNSLWIETILCLPRNHKDFGKNVYVKIG